MRLKCWPIYVSAFVMACLLAGCGGEGGGGGVGDNSNARSAATATTPDLPYATGPLPGEGFKAKITLLDPPAKLRAGQKQVIQVKVQNASGVAWKVRGGEADNKYYIAIGNRWLEADGQTLVNNMDGRYGLPNNLKPGEEMEAPLQITAPKNPGEYILDVDLVQEQVAWFHDKGSETAKFKITVVK